MSRSRRLIPVLLTGLALTSAFRAAALERSQPTLVVVSGRQPVTGGESVCFRLVGADDQDSDRIRVNVRFRGTVPAGNVVLDGVRGPRFTEDVQSTSFTVRPRGVHQLTLDLRSRATIDSLTITSSEAVIDQVACTDYERDAQRNVDLEAAPHAVDRLERGNRDDVDDDREYRGRRRDGRYEDRGYRDPSYDDLAYGSTIPARTRIPLILDARVSTETHRLGDRIDAHVADAVVVDGRTVLPSGTRVVGRISEAQPAGRFGRARLGLDFETAVLRDGTQVPINATVQELGPGSAGKQGGIIAGSAVGGALLGKVLGGDDQDALLGAIVGAGIATGSIAAKPGKPLVLPAGTEVVVELSQAAHVPVRRSDRRRGY